MAIYLYDSYTKSMKKLSEKNVNMYVCGLTPYDHAHIGHARTYVFFDVLKRFLLFSGKNVFHIQNVTDIDDKIIAKSKETGEDPLKIAQKFNDEAMELFDKLNIIRADIYPKVSEHIEDIIKAIEKLVKEGYAYETKTGVYFSIEKFPDYGKLSNQTLEELKKHRIEPDETKRNEADFALWKKYELYGWQSPFGKGRPGWHIECSVMALKYAKTLTIHGGGRDLIFPHHENEKAQSEALTKRPFAKIWLHAAHVTVNGVKMSKSLGNFITLKDALSKYRAEVLRLFFISSSISASVDFSHSIMETFENSLNDIESAYKTLLTIYASNKSVKNEEEKKKNAHVIKKALKLRKNFIKALGNNLNTPEALKHIYDLVKLINANSSIIDSRSAELLILIFNEFSFITGIKMPSIEKKGKEEELIKILIDVRDKLREKKMYDMSDEIRKKLKEIGVEIYDEGKETKIRYI